jgi:hypothetical protein
MVARRIWAGLTLVALATVGCSCSSGGGATGESTTAPVVVTTTTIATTTTTVAPTTTALTDEQAVRNTVERYWVAWIAAGDPPDPNNADYLAVTTGKLQKRETDDLREKAQLKMAYRLPSNSKFHHEIVQVAVAGDNAEVVECLVDDTLLVDQADGHIRNDRVSTSKILRKLTRIDGQWRISEDIEIEKHDGVAPCV